MVSPESRRTQSALQRYADLGPLTGRFFFFRRAVKILTKVRLSPILSPRDRPRGRVPHRSNVLTFIRRRLAFLFLVYPLFVLRLPTTDRFFWSRLRYPLSFFTASAGPLLLHWSARLVPCQQVLSPAPGPFSQSTRRYLFRIKVDFSFLTGPFSSEIWPR